MTLTEQWKNGELEKHRRYYVRAGEKIFTSYLDEHNCFLQSREEDSYQEYEEYTTYCDEVLAPVPKYEEWQQLKEDYVDKHDKYLRLSTTNHQLRKIIEGFSTLDVAKENQQLREILYKCREKLDWLNGGYDVWGGELTDFIEEIDKAIGEKK